MFRLSTGVHLLWFSVAHYQFPVNFHPQPASQQPHASTRSKPREGQQPYWCLSNNPLLLTCVVNPSRRLCHGYSRSLIVLYWLVVSRLLFQLHHKHNSLIPDGASSRTGLCWHSFIYTLVMYFQILSDGPQSQQKPQRKVNGIQTTAESKHQEGPVKWLFEQRLSANKLRYQSFQWFFSSTDSRCLWVAAGPSGTALTNVNVLSSVFCFNLFSSFITWISILIFHK